MPKDYGSWLLSDLKAKLRRRKAKVNGRKATLVQILQDYDAMLGVLVNNQESSYHIKLPNASEFADINSDTDVPILTDMDLKLYESVEEKIWLPQKTCMMNTLCYVK